MYCVSASAWKSSILTFLLLTGFEIQVCECLDYAWEKSFVPVLL